VTLGGLGAGELLALFGAFGGAMVVLYLLKLRRRRVEVPFAPLWARLVEDKRSTSLLRRLRRPFSLLVQLLVIACLVLALGDPRLSGLAGCAHEPPAPPPARHTLLLVDASASMASFEAGQTRLEAARAEARRVVEAATRNPNHRIMVVQLDAQLRPLTLWSRDRRALLDAIDAVAPDGALDTRAAVDDALRLAADAIRGREDPEVVLVTDRAFDPIPDDRVEALGLRVLPVGEATANVGVTAFNVRPYLDDSLTYAVFFAAHNATDRPLRATLTLYANDRGRSVADFVAPHRIVGSHAVDLPAHGVVERVIDHVKFEGSRLAARLTLAPDEPVRDVFPRDDVAFALVPERRQLAVQLVTTGNLFLYATLFVRENVTLSAVTPDAYRGPEGFDVTIVDGASVDLSRPGAYFLIDPAPGGPFEIVGVAREPQITRTDRGHPLLRHLKLADLNILEASHIRPARGDEVVAAAGNVPILLVRDDPETDRRFVVLAFDIRKSLLPMSYAFPLLVVNVLNTLFPEDDGLIRPHRAGEALSLPSRLEGEGPLRVEGPADAPPAHARRAADRVLLSATRVGVYEVRGEVGFINHGGTGTRRGHGEGLEDEEEGPGAGLERGGEGEGDVMPVAINLGADVVGLGVAPRGDYPIWEPPDAPTLTDDPWHADLWRVLLLAALALVAVEWLTWNRRWTV